MLNTFTTHLSSLHNKTKTLLHHLKTKHRLRTTKQQLSSKTDDHSTPSFASMEVSNQFKHVFKIIDANGDGTISPLELSQALMCLGHYEVSEAIEEAEGMVREVDCNGDGVIDLEEFMGVVVVDAMMQDGKDEHVLRDAFVIFDSDNDGLISAEELRRVLMNLGCNKCGIEECKRMIGAVDRNGDGFVDFNEFRLMMTVYR